MKARRLLSAIFLFLALPIVCQAQQAGAPEVYGTTPKSTFESVNNTNIYLNGVFMSNTTATVTADKGSVDSVTDDVVAEGDVTILDHGHIWRGTNFIYNFKTGQVHAGSFKSVQGAFNLSGERLTGTSTNNIYTATNAFITTDDYEKPAYRIRARKITIAVGQYFEAHQATLFWGKTAVFYFPYYRRNLGQHPNNWEFQPGYRSIFGPYLLTAYNWYGNGVLDGTIHMDVRQLRGIAIGPDLTLHMNRWGEAAFRYYYADDQDPTADGLTAPHVGSNRQRAALEYSANPWTNFYAQVVGEYESDPLFRRDFFEGEYNTNVEPASFAEGTKVWDNYTLDTMIQPRIVDYFETVERLPDVKLTGARSELGDSPLYYENESSIGYFKRAFSDTNSLSYFTNTVFGNGLAPLGTNYPGHDYAASRIDTFHQLTLPQTFFGWLNVTPNVGGRLTYYSDVDTSGPSRTNQILRAVFNTGMDVSFKASKTYRNIDSSLLDVHDLRHIIQPSIEYMYVPSPNKSPSEIPQFDYQSPSLRLRPISFPDNNDIDSITGENVMRFELRNTLQTKREKGVDNLINWDIYADWSLHPTTNHPWSDLYSDLDFRPRSWLSISSSTRYDMASNRWREAIERMVIQPTTAWSAAVTYRYLVNNDPELQLYPGEDLPGHNLIDLSVYYKLNENWGAHIAEQYEAQYGGMQQQIYSLYHDMRSWTASLTFRVTEGPQQPTDYTIAFMFSLKAFPRFTVGSDADRQGSLFSSPNVMDPATPYN